MWDDAGRVVRVHLVIIARQDADLCGRRERLAILDDLKMRVHVIVLGHGGGTDRAIDRGAHAARARVAVRPEGCAHHAAVVQRDDIGGVERRRIGPGVGRYLRERCADLESDFALRRERQARQIARVLCERVAVVDPRGDIAGDARDIARRQRLAPYREELAEFVGRARRRHVHVDLAGGVIGMDG